MEWLVNGAGIPGKRSIVWLVVNKCYREIKAFWHELQYCREAMWFVEQLSKPAFVKGAQSSQLAAFHNTTGTKENKLGHRSSLGDRRDGPRRLAVAY